MRCSSLAFILQMLSRSHKCWWGWGLNPWAPGPASQHGLLHHSSFTGCPPNPCPNFQVCKVVIYKVSRFANLVPDSLANTFLYKSWFRTSHPSLRDLDLLAWWAQAEENRKWGPCGKSLWSGAPRQRTFPISVYLHLPAPLQGLWAGRRDLKNESRP
jgi:hypothetical protein